MPLIPLFALRAADHRPDVLFILADDLGWVDTTIFGHTKFYKTPNLERLAKRGMTFTHAYSASPLCSPTRSAVLTGLSPARTGITAPNGHLPQVILQATVTGGAAPDKKAISPTVVTRLKIADHTIIIFTADNGGNMYHEVDGTTPTSNAPLRGGKATMFEGGTRVPCIIDIPGVTKPGSRNDTIVQSEDYYPTLLAALSLKPAPAQQFDGANILPVLKGEAITRDAVFQFFPHNPAVPDWLPPAVSVHRGDWKLIRISCGGVNGAHRYLLFNLRDDLGEKAKLAAQKSELVAELDAL